MSFVQKIVSQHKHTKYLIGSHEVRDLLKSTLIDSGRKEYPADHAIGHMPKDIYEKQTKLCPETLRKEPSEAPDSTYLQNSQMLYQARMIQTSCVQG